MRLAERCQCFHGDHSQSHVAHILQIKQRQRTCALVLSSGLQRPTFPSKSVLRVISRPANISSPSSDHSPFKVTSSTDKCYTTVSGDDKPASSGGLSSPGRWRDPASGGGAPGSQALVRGSLGVFAEAAVAAEVQVVCVQFPFLLLVSWCDGPLE